MAQINTYSIKIEASAGTTITDNRLLGRDVSSVMMDGVGNNNGYAKNRSDNYLTFTDGTVLYAGQKVTINLD